MKFPYIPIQPLIDEALEDVKTISKTSNFNDSDCYIWAVDCAREIGGYAYDDASTEIEIIKHSGFLPKDFYLINEMWMCKTNPVYASTPVRPSLVTPESKWIRTNILRPADSETRRRSRYPLSSNCSENSHTYKIRIPPGSIRTSFAEGILSLDYYRIPTQDGEIVVQDEINGIKCIKAYITYKLTYELWVMGEMRRDVHDDLKDDYETHLKIAQMIQKFIDPADTNLKAIEQDQRYRNMRYIYQ